MIWYCFSGAHILLFAVLLLLSYRAMLYVQKTNSIKLTVNELYDRVNSLSGCREEVGRKLAALYGNMGRRGPIAHISDNIEYSGVGSILPGLTPELYMLIVLITEGRINRYETYNTEIITLLGEPSPYNIYQEIYITAFRQRQFHGLLVRYSSHCSAITAIAGRKSSF